MCIVIFHLLHMVS